MVGKFAHILLYVCTKIFKNEEILINYCSSIIIFVLKEGCLTLMWWPIKNLLHKNGDFFLLTCE